MVNDESTPYCRGDAIVIELNEVGVRVRVDETVCTVQVVLASLKQNEPETVQVIAADGLVMTTFDRVT